MCECEKQPGKLKNMTNTCKNGLTWPDRSNFIEKHQNHTDDANIYAGKKVHGAQKTLTPA